MCEGGRRVIARGHDADVFGNIVPPDGLKLLFSSLARHRDRQVVGVNAALLVEYDSGCRARADEGPSGGTNPPRPRLTLSPPLVNEKYSLVSPDKCFL